MTLPPEPREMAHTPNASHQAKQAILADRARSLAQASAQSDSGGEKVEIIVFHLASETYGLPSTFVREAYPLRDFTPLPGLPNFVLGIVNVRGQILSVVDLKKFFNLPEKGLGQLNKLIILRDAHMEFAILADEILGARTLTASQIQPPPPTVSGIGAAYLRGVTAEHVIVLDVERLLHDDRIVVHQKESL